MLKKKKKARRCSDQGIEEIITASTYYRVCCTLC